MKGCGGRSTSARVPHCAAVSPEGKGLAVGGYRTAREDEEAAYHEAVARDGAFEDEPRAPFVRWTRLGEGASHMIETRHQREIRSIAWLEQNARLLTGGGDGQIRLTDCATGTIVAVAENVDRRTVHDLAVLPGDRAVLAACAWDLRLKLYDIDGLRFVHEIGGHELRSDNMLLCAAVNGDGTRAVTGAADGLVMLWDVAERRCLATFRGHEGGVRAVAIDSSGDWIASGGVDHTVRVWDVRRTEAERTLSGHTEPVWCVAVTDGGRSIASGSYDGTLRLWRGRRATSRWRTDGPALAVRLIDDGSHLVAAVRGRGVVRIEHAPLPL